MIREKLIAKNVGLDLSLYCSHSYHKRPRYTRDEKSATK